MNVLLQYLKGYWKLVVVALVLAATNQIFSLLDPLIARYLIDGYAVHPPHAASQFFHGAGFLLVVQAFKVKSVELEVNDRIVSRPGQHVAQSGGNAR